MDLHNRISHQPATTLSGIQTECHESGSSDLGQRHHHSLKPPSQTALDPLCIQEQRIEAPSAPFSVISGSDSPCESRLGSHSTDKKNIRLFGANLCLGGGNLSSVNLVKYKNISEISYLHSAKEGILYSRPSSYNNSIRLFGSNLCLSGTNQSSVNQQKFKNSEVLSLNSPSGSTLHFPSTSGNKSIFLFGSNLCLSGKNVSNVNQEKSTQTLNVVGLHSCGKSSTSSQPTLSNGTIRLFGSNIHPLGRNVFSTNPDEPKQTSKDSFGNKTSLHPSPSTSSYKITSEEDNNHPMEVVQVSNAANHMSSTPGIFGNEGKMGPLDSTYQANNGLHFTEKVDLTSPKQLHGNKVEPINSVTMTAGNADSTFVNILHDTAPARSQDTQEMNFTSDEVTVHAESQETQEMSFTDEVKYETTSSHLHETSTDTRSGERQKDYDEFLSESRLAGETSRNQNIRDITFPVNSVEYRTMLLPYHDGTSEAKSKKRQSYYDGSSSKNQLFDGNSGSQETQETSSTSNSVEHGISSPYLLGTLKEKYAIRRRDSGQFEPKNQLWYKNPESGNEMVVDVPNPHIKASHDPVGNEEILPPDVYGLSDSSSDFTGTYGSTSLEVSNEDETIISPPEATTIYGVTETKSLVEGNEEVAEDIQGLVVASPEPPLFNNEAIAPPLLVDDSGINVLHKRRRRNTQPAEFPKDVRSLLGTGILDGCPVFYYDYINKVKKWALIMRAYYLCGCPKCRFLKPVNAREFIRHCGCTSTRGNKLIVFKTGHSVDSIVKKIQDAPPNDLFKTISSLSGTVLNMENFRQWMERSAMEEQAANPETQEIQPTENQAT